MCSEKSPYADLFQYMVSFYNPEIVGGKCNINLEEKDETTILKYSVEAQIGGKLAQLGSRLIDSTSKKLAGKLIYYLQ